MPNDWILTLDLFSWKFRTLEKFLQVLGKFLTVYFLFGKSTLANLLDYWANFHCCKWPNIETQPFGHTGWKQRFCQIC